MHIEDSDLLAILRIGHDTSIRGEGLSLRDALARCDYERMRKEFRASDLVPLLRRNPDLMTQWVMYCKDKRTNGGFGVSEDTFEVGDSPESIESFASLEEAVAELVVRELDFWSEVGKRRSGDDT